MVVINAVKLMGLIQKKEEIQNYYFIIVQCKLIFYILKYYKQLKISVYITNAALNQGSYLFE